MALGSITIDLLLKTGAFNNDARLAERRLNELGKQAKIAGAVLGGVLAGGLTLIARNSMRAEQSLSQLDAILKSTGSAAGYTRDQMVDMARDFQSASTFSTNEIIDAQTRLLSYSGIVGENIPRAMQNVIDQSTRLGMSLSQSAEGIGKALESPIKAAAALSDQGFGAAFTDEVKATIEALVNAGREADAQILILEILEESYGGAAKAARETFGGALSALQNTIEDLTTGQSGSLNGATDAVNDLIDTLNDQAVTDGFQKIVSGAMNAMATLARFAATTASVANWLGEEVAARMHGAAADDIVRLEQERDRILGALNKVGSGSTEDIWNAGRRVLGLPTTDELRKRLGELHEMIDGYTPPKLVAPTIADPVTVDTSGLDLRTSKDRAADVRARAQAERDAEKALRELMQAEKEAADWARAFTAAQEDALAMLEDMRAEAEGPAAVALLKYSRLEQELGLLMAENVLNFEQYAEAMDLVHKAREKELASIANQADKVKDEMTVFAEQAQRNMQSWLGDSLYQSLSGSFDGIADAFSDMLKRMVAEMMASQILQFFMGNANTGQGGIFDLMGSGGWGYASGGYTGPGGRNKPAGVVHKGEVVWSQADIARAGGVGVVEAMRLGHRGYASGGVVGGGSVLAPGVTINVHNAPAGTEVRQSRDASGGLQLDVILKEFIGAAAGDLAGGGQMAQAIQGRYGLRPAV